MEGLSITEIRKELVIKLSSYGSYQLSVSVTDLDFVTYDIYWL